MKRTKFILTVGIFLLFSLPLFSFPVEDAKPLFNQEYYSQVKESIKKAREFIKVIMFEAGLYSKYPTSPSNLLLEELTKAKKRGVEVKVILERGKKGWRVTKRNQETAHWLKERGIEVRLDSPEVTTHAKLLIIDGKKVILGSTNWTYYSLTQNNETGVIINSRELAQLFEDYFDKLWKTSEIKGGKECLNSQK